MNQPHAQKLQIISHDIAINLLACTWSLAFQDAETDYSARQDIIDFFGMEQVIHLYHAGCIRWDPLAVPLQTELWETERCN